MLLLLSFAFLSGLVTILAPCIWPLLPIILSTTLGGKSHKRPLGITIGILLSFGIITLFISSLVRLFHFDPNVLRVIAVIVISALGVSFLIPSFNTVLELFISRLSGVFKLSTHKTNDFTSGFLTGLTLGIVWTPCAGPILAAIAALSITGQVTGTVVFITLAYLLGVGIPLFLFAYGGQQLFAKTKFISSHTGRIQQIFGVIMILTAVAIYTNFDKVIQASLLNAFPQLTSSITNIDNSQQIKQQLDVLKGSAQQNSGTNEQNTSGLLNTNYPAPEFTGITKWINPSASSGQAQQKLSISSLKGKVVLVDFWTYTCINCIRTLPFITKWYDKYKDQGFVVVGVHTPEFEFEKNTTNVENAIKLYGIHYPVGQDNNYATWNAYSNQYWPAEYLIDANGNVRRTHFGEGEYDQSEQAIQLLLKEAGHKVTSNLVSQQDQTPHGMQTPETYVGLNRMERFGSNEGAQQGIHTYTVPNGLTEHYFGFSGSWEEQRESAIPQPKAGLNFNFTADKVFLVITPNSKDARIKVLLDDKPITAANAGVDVKNSYVSLDNARLYNVVDLHGNQGNHMLRLEFENGGVVLYAFTFG